MSRKIILFGATGYTGHLTARALIKFGAKPLLVGRNLHKLKTLAKELGGCEYALANIEDISSLSMLINQGDILISTVGPFTRYGETALQAAIDKQAHYVDSTGEPGFIRKVFEKYGPLAKQQNITLLTAMGYDYVPGNCAAAAALNMDSSATRVDIGYFVTGKNLSASQGTQASITQAMLEPGVYFREGRLHEKMADAKVRRFTIAGLTRPAASVPGSEHLALPSSFPQLQEINTYLGWFGNASYLMPLFSGFHALLYKLPGYYGWLDKHTQKRNNSQGKGPSAQERAHCDTQVQAIAYSPQGRALSAAALLGANPYEFTADILALTAMHGLEKGFHNTGALGPVEAFGHEQLVTLCANAGLILSTKKLVNSA